MNPFSAASPSIILLPHLFPHLLAFGVDGFKALELILLYGRSGKRAGLLEPAFGLALVVLIQRAVGEMQ